MNDLPSWEEFILPIVRVMSDGAVRLRREINQAVADELDLTHEQRSRVYESGGLVYQGRASFAISLLKNVGALDRPARATYQITDAGKQILTKFPHSVTENELKAWAEEETSPLHPYVATGSRAIPGGGGIVEPTPLTPDEQIRSGVSRIHESVSAELLDRLRGRDPGFFEAAVVDLLLAMGYGGTGGRGTVTQLSHDGGIDGVIDQDVLGLSRVYVQAKLYAEGNTVQRSDVQAFVGALSGKADGGIFITTSRFSDGAVNYAEGVPPRIILIGGERLTDLMIRYRVGVQVQETIHIVEIDEDFFDESTR